MPTSSPIPARKPRELRQKAKHPAQIAIVDRETQEHDPSKALHRFDGLLTDVSFKGCKIATAADLKPFEAGLRTGVHLLAITTRHNGDQWVQRGTVRWITTRDATSEMGVECEQTSDRVAWVERLSATTKPRGRWALGLAVATLGLGVLGALFSSRADINVQATPRAVTRQEARVQAQHQQGLVDPGIRNTAAPTKPMNPVGEAHPIWRKTMADHDSRSPLDEAQKQARLDQLTSFFSSVDAAQARDPRWEKQAAIVRNLDCKEGACLAELEFKTYAGGMAYTENLREGRFHYELKVKSIKGCKVGQVVLPRQPGEQQPQTRGLVQLTCDESLLAKTAADHP